MRGGEEDLARYGFARRNRFGCDDTLTRTLVSEILEAAMVDEHAAWRE
jgi:hypothetical protein